MFDAPAEAILDYEQICGVSNLPMKLQVYAVVRIDEYQKGEAAIKVKEILPTMEEAIKEVDRLNTLNSSKGAHYFWQSTNYFADGRNTNKP